MTITVADLYIYPIKSMAGMRVESCVVTAEGLQHDRQWMVVDAAGTMMTQREHPQMALVSAALNDDQLVLESFGLDDHVVPNDAHGERVSSNVFGADVVGISAHPSTNEWLSQALDTPCQLLRFADDFTREQDVPNAADHASQTYFADAWPLLTLSTASFTELNSRLPNPVTMMRFRPNIVIQGCSNAHEEDTWARLRIAEQEYLGAMPCARCSLTTVDPVTGEFGAGEPLQTLGTYRQQSDGEIYFGVNMVPMLKAGQSAAIRVGDELTPLQD